MIMEIPLNKYIFPLNKISIFFRICVCVQYLKKIGKSWSCLEFLLNKNWFKILQESVKICIMYVYNGRHTLYSNRLKTEKASWINLTLIFYLSLFCESVAHRLTEVKICTLMLSYKESYLLYDSRMDLLRSCCSSKMRSGTLKKKFFFKYMKNNDDGHV